MRHIVLKKTLGQTPLQAIDAWRLEHPVHKNIAATYAGRLDPMATGDLLVLLGEECKNQEKYRGLDKEYVVEVLLDFGTDTGDILGLPAYKDTETHPSAEQVREIFQKETGTKEVPYPAFSSKTINGKPLFLYSLEGTLDTVSIPSHEETIYRISHKESKKINKTELEERIWYILSKAPRSEEPSKVLGADFRQNAVRDAWLASLSSIENRMFSVLTLRVTCGSGTYMRSLAGRIGKELGTQAVAFSIHRTRVGRYRNFPFGFGVWTRNYR